MTALFQDVPLTGGDLRDIADALDTVEATTLAAQPAIGRIEVHLPGCDEQIGWLIRFDDSDPDAGWGYTPEENAGRTSVKIGEEITIDVGGDPIKVRLRSVTSSYGEGFSATAEFSGGAR